MLGYLCSRSSAIPYPPHGMNRRITQSEFHNGVASTGTRPHDHVSERWLPVFLVSGKAS